jgi:hypothetical protein
VVEAYEHDGKGGAKELAPSDCGDRTATKVYAGRFGTLDKTGIIAAVCAHLNWQFAFTITTGERLVHRCDGVHVAAPMGGHIVLDDIACMVCRHVESLGASRAGFMDGAAHLLFSGTAGHMLGFVCDALTTGPGPALHLWSRPLRYQPAGTDGGGSLQVAVPTAHGVGDGSGVPAGLGSGGGMSDGAYAPWSTTLAPSAAADHGSSTDEPRDGHLPSTGQDGNHASTADGDAGQVWRRACRARPVTTPLPSARWHWARAGTPKRLGGPVPAEVRLRPIPSMHMCGHACAFFCGALHSALHVSGAGDYGEPNEQSFAVVAMATVRRWAPTPGRVSTRCCRGGAAGVQQPPQHRDSRGAVRGATAGHEGQVAAAGAREGGRRPTGCRGRAGVCACA